MPDTLPYFIQDLAGIGGTLKQRPEDFVVHEMPAYEASGAGEHVMLEIEKTAISTFEAIDTLARRLKVPRRDIGYAGLKDTRAVTRQWLTVRGVDLMAVSEAATDKLKILFADKHGNKLRVGHLRGNRFTIKVRDVDPMRVVTLTPALRTLSERGMPNYFGPQRFGRRDRNDELGLAYAKGDADGVLAQLLGRPDDGDNEAERAARMAYDAGDLSAAAKLWPHHARDELTTLNRLIRTRDAVVVVAGIDRRLTGLWLSALQSRLFNTVVARRIDAIDGLLEGDIAFKHENGASFAVADAAIERPRVEVFDISVTGPLIGPRMMRPQGAARDVERAALADCGLEHSGLMRLYDGEDGDDVRALASQLPPGARRPLRVRPDDLRAESGIDEHGPYIAVSFALPAGSYATVLLRELMRNDAVATD
ncbi:MAG TPA: tRNA pseudouridine(13) synthase TruD [Tepidisphaeraceae bacterium]|jgi:tRNA pseudouridine13 synthase